MNGHQKKCAPNSIFQDLVTSPPVLDATVDGITQVSATTILWLFAVVGGTPPKL